MTTELLNFDPPWKVLAVDDDELYLPLISDALRGAGFEVSSTSSGVEAIAMIKADCPRALVLDWNLGPSSGKEDHVTGRAVLESLREVDPLSWVAVISGDLRQDGRSDSIGNRADLFFAKPLPFKLLIDSLLRWRYRDENSIKILQRGSLRTADDVRAEHFLRALKREGNKSKAANALQVDRATIAKVLHNETE